MDSNELPPVPLPYLHLVRATRPSAPALTDVVAATRATLDKAHLDLPAGAPVAVAVGSRGIANYAKIAGAVVAWLKERGSAPFIIPAMGSHGGATAEAQQAVLAKYGIDEAHMGVPVRSSMETVLTGVTESGIEVFMDKHAFEAGRVILVNRVKAHTTFTAKVESGIMKMSAIGLGNLEGARRFHSSALRMGFEKALLEMARVNLRSGKILGGVAILENDAHQTAGIEAITAAMSAANLEIEEPRLLARAREIRPQLPFRNLDLLIVDEIGKDISGTGMDTRVTGRSIHHELDGADSTGTTPGFIRIRRIYVRDLTHATEGNACGVGLADMVHERLFRKTDFALTNVNATTSLGFRTARMPMWFPSDRDAIFFAMRNMGLPSPGEVKIVRIRNTNHIDSFLASPACVRSLRDTEHSEQEHRDRYQVGDGVPVDFDDGGNLISVAAPLSIRRRVG